MDLRNTVITEIDGFYLVHTEKSWRVEMRDRKCYGLSLCREGQITYVQNGREYVSDRNCAVILPKYGNYLIRGDKPGQFPVINFDCQAYLCDTVTVIPVQNPEQLLKTYDRISKLFYSNGNRMQIFSIFYEMLHQLSQDRIPYELRCALHEIQKHYSDPQLTNIYLAEKSGISEVYLRKLFNKHFSCSPKQFVIDFRIQKAKQFLAEGIWKIASISENCGFANPYHFCRVFKQHTGMTPSEYRKENHIQKI